MTLPKEQAANPKLNVDPSNPSTRKEQRVLRQIKQRVSRKNLRLSHRMQISLRARGNHRKRRSQRIKLKPLRFRSMKNLKYRSKRKLKCNRSRRNL